MGMCLFLQQAFNATAVVLHMRHLQLGNSQEAPSLSPLPSPCGVITYAEHCVPWGVEVCYKLQISPITELDKKYVLVLCLLQLKLLPLASNPFWTAEASDEKWPFLIIIIICMNRPGASWDAVVLGPPCGGVVDGLSIDPQPLTHLLQKLFKMGAMRPSCVGPTFISRFPPQDTVSTNVWITQDTSTQS